MISDKEWGRYERQMLVPGWDRAVQEKLKGSTVLVAGAGGLGGTALLYLARAGVGNLRICDNDVVEVSNLNRQILHTDQRLGSRKADSAETAILEANPFARVSKRYDTLTRENAEEIVGGADVIVDGLDSFEARHVLNEISVRKRIPLIHAGVSGFRGQMTVLHPPETPCLWCLFPVAGLSDAVPMVGCTPGVMGALQAAECVKYLTGLGQVLRGRLLHWNGETMEFHVNDVERNPRCPVCSGIAAP